MTKAKLDKAQEKRLYFIGKIMIRSGREVLCIGIPKEVKELVNKGEIYQVSIRKLK